MSPAVDQVALAEALNAAYAAGALERPLALLAETRAAMGAVPARDLALSEAVAVAAFEAQRPAPLARDALERVLALAAVAGQERPAARFESDDSDPIWREVQALPGPTRAAAQAALRAGKWGGGLGVKALPLMEVDGCRAELLRIEPGHGAPRHSHEGAEYTLVLTGAFDDGLSRYIAGDIAVAGPRVTHRPIAEPGAVCYALAVTDAPLRFTGALGLLQSFLRH